MKTVNFLNKSLVVSASFVASILCNPCLGQEAPTAKAPAEPKMSLLTAFRRPVTQNSSQDTNHASKTGVLATLSDESSLAPTGAYASRFPTLAIGSNASVGDSGFQNLTSYRTGMPVPEHFTQSHMPVPAQFSDLGRYRVGGSIGSADFAVPVSPAWETGNSFVTALPASSSSLRIQDAAANFHEDLRSPLSKDSMKNSGLTGLIESSTPSQMLDESNMVLAANSKTWVTPDLYWKPLYFEDAAAERYGHHAGVFQPALSAGRFLRDTVFLPYKFSAHPPYECEFGLGYERPGNCVEPRCQRPEISGRGILGQGAAVTGLIFLF